MLVLNGEKRKIVPQVSRRAGLRSRMTLVSEVSMYPGARQLTCEDPHRPVNNSCIGRAAE